MDEFFEYFNIPKIEYRSPSRTWSGDEVDYYVEYYYPPVEEVFFDLLNYYNMQLNGEPLTIIGMNETKLCHVLTGAILNRVKELGYGKEDIKEIFDEVFSNIYERREEC